MSRLQAGQQHSTGPQCTRCSLGEFMVGEVLLFGIQYE